MPDQAADEEEASRALSMVADLRHELAAAEERAAGARNAVVDAQRALASAQADAGRARAAAAAADERRSGLEAELAQVTQPYHYTMHTAEHHLRKLVVCYGNVAGESCFLLPCLYLIVVFMIRNV